MATDDGFVSLITMIRALKRVGLDNGVDLTGISDRALRNMIDGATTENDVRRALAEGMSLDAVQADKWYRWQIITAIMAVLRSLRLGWKRARK